MKPVNQLYILSILVLSIFTLSAQASDLAKEKRWADQIVDNIFTGEPVWLNAGKQKFLGIYTESETKPAMGAAIVMHGIGVHPDWADVVNPLRTRLPESGWHTLSIQMPILENKAEQKEYIPLFPEVAPRINAAMSFLKQKGIKKVVLVGHSLGATMAGYYAANHLDQSVRALVAIGATGYSFKDDKLDYIASLKKIRIPVMDLSGSDDLPDVVKTKKLKAETAKAAGNKRYDQIEIQGANHFLVGKENELVKAVSNWLKNI